MTTQRNNYTWIKLFIYCWAVVCVCVSVCVYVCVCLCMPHACHVCVHVHTSCLSIPVCRSKARVQVVRLVRIKAVNQSQQALLLHSDPECQWRASFPGSLLMVKWSAWQLTHSKRPSLVNRLNKQHPPILFCPYILPPYLPHPISPLACTKTTIFHPSSLHLTFNPYKASYNAVLASVVKQELCVVSWLLKILYSPTQ